MSEWVKVIILGIIEGITEFLPISSTGHIIVSEALLNFQDRMGGTFAIAIQLGAVMAVLAYYRRDLWQQFRMLPSSQRVRQYWLFILIAILPAATMGFLLRDWIKGNLFTPVVVAVSLIIGGIIFIMIERRPQQTKDTMDNAVQITLRQALLIGLIQTSALIPGVSRSGASIIGGMRAGLTRQAATRFSFFLAIPTLGGATIVELMDSLNGISDSQITALLLGAVVSGVVAWFSIGWLLRYVSNHTFTTFGYYRIAAGLIILLLAAGDLL